MSNSIPVISQNNQTLYVQNLQHVVPITQTTDSISSHPENHIHKNQRHPDYASQGNCLVNFFRTFGCWFVYIFTFGQCNLFPKPIPLVFSTLGEEFPADKIIYALIDKIRLKGIEFEPTERELSPTKFMAMKRLMDQLSLNPTYELEDIQLIFDLFAKALGARGPLCYKKDIYLSLKNIGENYSIASDIPIEELKEITAMMSESDYVLFEQVIHLFADISHDDSDKLDKLFKAYGEALVGFPKNPDLDENYAQEATENHNHVINAVKMLIERRIEVFSETP